MKKIIFASVVIALCLSITAFAASTFTISVDSVNEREAGESNVIYTPAFGEKVPVADGDYYVITVIPRITSGDISEEDNMGDNVLSSEDESAVIPEISEDASIGMPDVDEASDVASQIPETSDIIPEIISTESVVESASTKEYKYRINSVYTPADDKSNISIPENGFAVIFRDMTSEGTSSVESDETSARSISELEAGAPVAVYGVDFENNTANQGAYIEVDLSDKGLLGDIPQTSDMNLTALFTVLASLSVLSAALFCRRKAA